MIDKDHKRDRLLIGILEPAGMLYGSELALLDILEHLDRSRFLPEVVLPRRSAFTESLRKANIPFREALVPMAHQAGRIKKVPAYLRLALHWWRKRPDVVYVNQGGILRPAAAIARWLDLPLVCQIQTLEDARWVSSLSGIHHEVSSFVCNSHFMAAETKVPKDRLSMLYYGYRMKGLPVNKRRGVGKPLEVGLLGRICESKGHYLLVEVARRLKAANCSDFHFRFIGDAATSAGRDRIQNLVVSEGIGHLIEFRGYRTDIASELSALDLMAIPSIAEPFGRIYCEAVEARLPVLVSDGGGLGELVRHFRAGLLFASSDAGDFLEKLFEMRLHYAVHRSEFERAAEPLLSSLSMDSYVNVMAQLLESVALRQSVSVVWEGNRLIGGDVQP